MFTATACRKWRQVAQLVLERRHTQQRAVSACGVPQCGQRHVAVTGSRLRAVRAWLTETASLLARRDHDGLLDMAELRVGRRDDRAGLVAPAVRGPGRDRLRHGHAAVGAGLRRLAIGGDACDRDREEHDLSVDRLAVRIAHRGGEAWRGAWLWA